MSKYLNDKDFFVCSGGLMPTQMMALQDKAGKKDNKGLFLREPDVYTTPLVDFSCKKLMVLMAIVAVVVCALTIATGGAALIAAAAIGGLIGAKMGSLICGNAAALARKWIEPKNKVLIGSQKALTDKSYMICQIFGDQIRYTPYVKTWSQALALGASNFIGEMFKCVMVGAAAAGIAVLATEGILGFVANAVINYASTWLGGGLLLRSGLGVNQVVQEKYGAGETDMDAAFERGFWSMETGTAEAATHIKEAVVNDDTSGLFESGDKAMDMASNANAYTKPLAYVCAGTGYLEDFTALLGWGAGKGKGSGDPIFGKKPTVEPRGFDPMGEGKWEGKPQSGKTGFLESPRMSRAELAAYKKGLQSKGIETIIDKKGVLPEDVRAGFDPSTGKVYLRKGATHYEAFHERAHAEQWAEMGKEKYNKQTRLQREQHVYDEIMKNKEKFSEAELDHAKRYINRLRKEAGVDPLDAMEETSGKGIDPEAKAKGAADGDLYEDPAASKELTKTGEEGKANENEPPQPLKYDPTPYEFEKMGYLYESKKTIGTDGSVDISHYIVKDGVKTPIGFSEINGKGQLTNYFEVPAELRGKGISKAIYENLETMGVKSIEGTYYPKSDNYKAFMKVYDPVANNKFQAIKATPAYRAMPKGYKVTKVEVATEKVTAEYSKTEDK